MTDKVQKIREEVERLFKHVKDSNFESDSGAFYYLEDLLNFIDSLQEEPVSIWHDSGEEPKEGFTIVVYMKDDSLKVLTSWGENGDFCIGEGFWCNIHQQRKWAYVDDLVNLSNIQRTVKDWKEEPVSEDLEEYINELSKQFPEVSFAKLSRIAVRVVKWQKEQMMAKAVDGEIGYWNIRGLSVNMDLPRTLEEDDKVKLIIIKEDKV